MNDNSKLYDSIEILNFEVAPVPDNYMDVFIKYKDFFVSLSNFHFTPKTDLKKAENWSLTDSKAVHGIDHFGLVDGTICDCGKILKRKYSVSQNDFCQELSKTSFKNIVLEKILQDEKLIDKIISKANFGQRNNFISPYGDLSEMEDANIYKIKNSFWEGVELEYIEKVSQKKNQLSL